MSVGVIIKAPYAKGSNAAGNARYIAKRIGVDKSINNRIVRNAKYIATRPMVEKLGGHGLFSNKTNINLNQVIDELKSLNCNVWMPVISLKREDAERLGYNNAKAWQTLIKSKQADIAKNLNIPLTDLKWYAAFHNKEHHPHIHMLIYSKSGGGYLSPKGIRNLRSAFTRQIFKDELYQLYDFKTDIREKLVRESREKLENLRADFIAEPSSELNILMIDLAKNLKKHKGKKTYSYLSKDTKRLVDLIYQKLSEDRNIAAIYNEWCNIQGRIMGYYQEKEIEFPKLCENKEFNKIRNKIISAAEEAKSISIDKITGGLIYSIFRTVDSLCREENRQEERRFTQSLDSKEYQKLAKKKQALGIKMGGM